MGTRATGDSVGSSAAQVDGQVERLDDMHARPDDIPVGTRRHIEPVTP